MTLNTLANALPINGRTTGELSDQYENLFVPAGLTFSIWGVIYILLLLYVIQGFRNRKKDSSIFESGYAFFLSGLFNASWIVAWHYEMVGVSLLIMFGLFGSLLFIYQRLYKSTSNEVLPKIAIGVYLGWITVATIANTTALLVDLQWGGFGLSEVFWTCLVVVVALIISATLLKQRKDVAFALVVIWAFVGIIIKRRAVGIVTDDPVEWVVEISLGLLVVFFFYFGFIRKGRPMTLITS